MMMNRIQASQEAIAIAKTAILNDEALAVAEGFKVLKLPEGDLDHMVLVLFEAGRGFSQHNMPRDVVIPVEIDGRQGYLWEKQAAMRFASDCTG